MSQAKKTVIQLSDEMMNEVMKLTSKSSQIRYLHAHGVQKADIARFMNIRYQHVRNVLLQPLKKMNG